MKTKDLIINGIIYAKYEISKNILFIKVLKNLVKNEIDNENVLCNIIQLVEKKKFKLMSYLNI